VDFNFATNNIFTRASTCLPRSTESLPVVIVNESFVRKFFPESDVLGRRIRVGRPDEPSPWRTIIGVVPDMYMEGMRQFMAGAGPAGYYIPMSQSEMGQFARIAVRTQGAPMAVTPDVRAAVESLDPNLPIYEVVSMPGLIDKETWPYRVFNEMFVVFGFIALFLASVGLYSVMRFAVSRRTKELGIRLALGANNPSLVRLVMKRGAVQLGIGMTLGLVLVASAAGPLQVLLYEGDVRDPAVFGLVVLSLAVTGVLASFVPAYQITRLDPVSSLTPE
jgi:hypothetical protein